MLLLFATPVPTDHPVYFGVIPARALIHGILFWGFTHVWIGTLKKQMKFEVVRRKAIPIVFVASLILMLIAEGMNMAYGMKHVHCFANSWFDLLGTGIGILSFRLLYVGCY